MSEKTPLPSLPPDLPDATPLVPPPHASLLPLVREILETIVFAVLVFLVIQTIWRNFWVEGQSMEPNLHNGQYLIVEHLAYSDGFPVNVLRDTIGRWSKGRELLDRVFHAPERGDVIVFAPPLSPSRDFVKRVVGIPGDRVEVRQGRVYLNDKALTETYIRSGSTSSWGPAIVGQGELFVLGDNRGNSTDSRSFGMLQQKSVVGRAWISYWPPRNWGFIKHYDLAAQLQ